MVSYKKQAAELNQEIREHSWFGIYQRTLEAVNPDLYEELDGKGELDDFCLVRTAEALQERDDLIANGMTSDQASEMALADFMPQDPNEEVVAEDWEVDGHAEDEAEEFSEWLGGEFE